MSTRTAALMEATYRQASGAARPPVMLGILNGKTYTPKRSYFAMQSMATLFDTDTHPEPGCYCALSPLDQAVTLVEPTTMFFRRRGAPMLAYYQAANVQDKTPIVPVDVVFYCDTDRQKAADVLRDPVLVDPIARNVYAITDWDRINRPGQFRAAFRFKSLPCLDYPLLITDKSVIQ